jgi:sensor histidine kinase YesM
MDYQQPKSADLVALPWWLTECLFWLGFCLTEFVWLDLYYGNNPTLGTIARVLVEAFLGAAFARPILWSTPWLERLSILPRIAVVALIVMLMSQAWNVVRMLSYPMFFPGAYIWNQYGGWAFSAVAIFALWTALFYSARAYKLAAYQREVAQREHLERLNAERLSSNAKLKMLRYQVNPHFIFNTLNSINALIATSRSQDARSMINGLSDLLRKTLEHDPPLMVSVLEELDTAERYLQVEKMRFGDRLLVKANAEAAAQSVFVPSLILQPLVENAVRHAVEAQTAICEISIEARMSDDRLVISVSDTGPGLQSERRSGGAGLGISNVRARLESVYGAEARFSISNREGGGVQTLLDLPRVVPEHLQ